VFLFGIVSCVGSRADPSNKCFVVDAGASLYFDPESACSDAVKLTKEEIRAAIESGSFNGLESRIIKVSYLEESDSDFIFVNTVQGSGTSGVDERALLPAYTWVLVGIGGVLLLLAIATIFKRLRRSALYDAANTDPADDIDCAPSISDNTWYDQGQSSENSSEKVPQDDHALLPKIESQEDDTPLSEKQEGVDSPPQPKPPKDEDEKLKSHDDTSNPSCSSAPPPPPPTSKTLLATISEEK